MSGGTYSLTSNPNDKFVEKLFFGKFTLRVFAMDLLRGNRRRNSSFIFCFDMSPGIRIRTLSVINQHSRHGLVSSVSAY